MANDIEQSPEAEANRFSTDQDRLPPSRRGDSPQTGEPSNAPIFVPGQVVICTDRNPVPPYHTFGWHWPEPEFTWIDGIAGRMEFLIRRPAVSYALRMEVEPVGGSVRPQRLDVYFNYFRIAGVEVPARKEVEFALPAELFILRRARIDLYCPDALAGAERNSPDLRRLGIAVCRWSIG